MEAHHVSLAFYAATTHQRDMFWADCSSEQDTHEPVGETDRYPAQDIELASTRAATSPRAAEHPRHPSLGSSTSTVILTSGHVRFGSPGDNAAPLLQAAFPR